MTVLTRKRQPFLLRPSYLRKGETFAELAAGFGIGVTTAWKYVNETVSLLAPRAPKLRTAVRDATKKGHAYVVVDGTLVPIDRVAADRPFCPSTWLNGGVYPTLVAEWAGHGVDVLLRIYAKCVVARTSSPSGG